MFMINLDDEQRLIIIIMAKRTLPHRTSRGQLPAYLRDPQPAPVKQLKNTPKDKVEAERKDKEQKFRGQQLANMRKYPFCRAVHYHFDLDSFRRVKGHISYVLDDKNALKNTFSKDAIKINETTYGELLNRKLFGLPVNSRPDLVVKKQNRFKNICSGYLFDIEDKKYQNDRILCTLKVVLSQLKKRASFEVLRKFDILSKDVDLEEILDEKTSYQEKIKIVELKIQTLENRKQTNWLNWQPDDMLYYYHSLNQKLHNQVNDLKQNLTRENLILSLFPVSSLRSKSKTQLQKYYFTQENAVSVKLQNPQPSSIYYFNGSMKVLKIAGQIVVKNCQTLGETTYYQVRQMIKNIFKFQPSFRSQKSQNITAYQRSLRKRCEQIKKVSQNMFLQRQKSPFLDKYLRNGVLTFKDRKQLSGKEYQLIILMFWLCMGLQQIFPILELFPDILSFVSSEYFPKMYSYLVDATNSAYVGVMCSAIEGLSDLFSKPDLLINVPMRLSFQFQPSLGVGMLFRDDVELQTEPSNRTMVEQQKCNPSKKVKRDFR